jgi:hypothetical protein
MNIKNKSIKNLTLGFAFCMVCFSCQKWNSRLCQLITLLTIRVAPTRIFGSLFLRFHFRSGETD